MTGYNTGIKRCTLLSVLITALSFITGCLHLSTASAPAVQDPCKEVKALAEKATHFAKQVPYTSALAAITRAATDKKEHAVSFGCMSNDSVIYSTVSNGAVNTATVPVIAHRFADLHNHPEDRPPSSGDFYHFIDQAKANNGQYQKFIVLPNGTQYALVLVDATAAEAFNIRFPRVRGIRNTLDQMQYQPTFPKALVEEINQLKGWHGATEETAMALILQKYNTGVALLKKDADGNFRKVYTMEKEKGGARTYTTYTCSD
ncbi:hypothetical protein LQ567_23225 [Niabella pedocola]|uniref:Uncharacterized protein n=1 Tax=Niabella pedocola TaxID=1752077 RepID=A0ABS8PXB0_9BACT|nr:hypothetical protein [Niabella pedocola]MCD2425715.1 hypothetical protein [Niabella pedocola]